MKSRLSESVTNEIQQLLNKFLNDWNNKDLTAFIENFVENAEFTDVVNQTAVGKVAIEKQHEFAFNVVMKNATLEMNNYLIREILPNVIIVSASWLNKKSQTPHGQSLPDRNGVIQFVIVKNDDANWKFKLVHNADFSLPYEKRDGFIR